MNYVILYPDSGEENQRIESLIGTAFNNVNAHHEFDSVSVNLIDRDMRASTFDWLAKVGWSTSGTLVLSEVLWQSLLEHFERRHVSERSGYRHLIFLQKDEQPVMTIKTDSSDLTLSGLSEYIKWLVLEAGYFEVEISDTEFN